MKRDLPSELKINGKIATFRIFLYILSKFGKIGWTVFTIVNSNRNF